MAAPSPSRSLAVARSDERGLFRQAAEPEHERDEREEDQYAQTDHLGRVESAGVAAYLLVSCTTCHTCQYWRMPERANPMSPMSHVNVTARTNRAYCERGGILPHWIAPNDCAPRPISTSITVTNRMHPSTAST